MKKYIFLLLLSCLSFLPSIASAYSLTVRAEGPGTILVEYYTADGEYGYYNVGRYLHIENMSEDTPIVLSAIPYGNELFVRWDGNIQLNMNPAILVLEKNTSVVGVFDSFHCISCGNYYTYNCYDYGDCGDYVYDDYHNHTDDDCCFIQSLK